MNGLRRALVVALPLALAGCNVPDDSRAEGAFSPQGLNAANLAAMVADPADLVHGHGDPGPDRKLSAHAVSELWTNPTTSLPQGGAGAGGASSGGSSGGASGGSDSATAGGASGASGSGN